MVKEINGSGINRAPLQQAPQQQDVAGSSRAAGKAEARPETAGAGRAVSDSVSLSSNAQSLKSAGEKLQKLPEVNEKRVAEIRAALESGEYKVDDLVLADKLLAAEDLFR
jgi:negative regulator of flagellin synthesis FlgM